MTDVPLTELATQTGVTPRTVRYYIAQGLLPAPLEQGRGARYTDRHADRIRLIKRLQREHLPLAEIRARLAALEDGQVRAVLAEADPDRAPVHGLAEVSHLAATTEPPADTALRYIRRVLDEGIHRGPGVAGRALRRVQSPPPAPPAPFVQPAPRVLPQPGIAPIPDGLFERDVPDEYPLPRSPGRPTHHRDPPVPPMTLPSPGMHPADRSTWERITLTPDLELHVRRPLDRETNRLLDRLLAHARELLRNR